MSKRDAKGTQIHLLDIAQNSIFANEANRPFGSDPDFAHLVPGVQSIPSGSDKLVE